ncbi:hypothetical protein TWF281_010894 [Arthrobotrys megalospora]
MANISNRRVDLAEVTSALRDIATAIGNIVIPNPIGMPDSDRLLAAMNGLQEAIREIKTDITGIKTDVAGVKAEMKLNPMRMYNGTASEDSPLKFPEGVRLLAIIPSKSAISELTIEQCRTVLSRLGLAYGLHEEVKPLREKIREHLGAW